MHKSKLFTVLVLATIACQLPSVFLGNDTETEATPTQNSSQETPSQSGLVLQPEKAPTLAGCPVFPVDNIWNVPVDQMPVDKNSQAYIQSIGADLPLHPDFGSGLYDGGPIGIPITVVPASQQPVPVAFDYEDESDPGPYPIPANSPIEGGPDSDGDRHILIVDQDNCKLYELFYAFPESDGSWSAASGAIYDLNSNNLRPETWTSADAAGLPILPGLIRYEEVATGEINHALRFTAPQTRQAFVWPARHFASDLTDEAYPAMGQRFRLRADFDASGFSPEVQVIIKALKTYGMILADNGSPWFISGSPNEAWDNDALVELKQITGSDFEAVDVSSLMVDPNSGQARVVSQPSAPSQPESTNGHITYSLENGKVYRIQAQEGAQPEDISAALDNFSPGKEDSSLILSPDGQWMVLTTDRFGCADWPCLAILSGDLSNAEAVMSGGDVIHPEGISVVASGGNLIVYPAPDGPHDLDLWAVTRQADGWSTPTLLTRDSSLDVHRYPAISADGSKVIFTCEKGPIGTNGKSLCEVGVNGEGFRLVLTPAQGPGGQSLTDLHQPDYAPDGSLVFEADVRGEQIWRLEPGASTPALITDEFANDNSPCVLPDGRVVSLWLDRPGATGAHELKVMQPDGSSFFILLPDLDVFDIGLGCGE